MSKIIREERGGFGRVQIIEEPSGDRLAKKLFDPSTDVINASSWEKLQKRFRLEVMTQSKLSTDYTVPILASCLDGEDLWFTMPFCERNFEVEIDESRARDQIPKKGLADILNALEEIHSLGYVHRDLKPQNILLNEDRWKLSDFGLVLPPSGEVTKITGTLSSWGTANYSAPEQLLDFGRSTHLADIYAFGCILHDIFDGGPRVPYTRQSSDGPIGVVIERCTEQRPERRLKDIAAVRSALFTVLSSSENVRPSSETAEWAARLPEYGSWETEEFRRFVRFIIDPENETGRWSLLKPVDEDMISSFYALDPDYAETLFLEYCDWINQAWFEFEFCDVVVGRLMRIFDLGRIEHKALAVMAMAALGKRHNRWYVMRRLLRECGSTMDERLAQRIAIEIQVNDAYWNFIDSAERVNNSIEDFHPRIFDVLDERKYRFKSRAVDLDELI